MWKALMSSTTLSTTKIPQTTKRWWIFLKILLFFSRGWSRKCNFKYKRRRQAKVNKKRSSGLKIKSFPTLWNLVAMIRQEPFSIGSTSMEPGISRLMRDCRDGRNSVTMPKKSSWEAKTTNKNWRSWISTKNINQILKCMKLCSKYGQLGF